MSVIAKLRFLKIWRDLIFPPFCTACKDRCETKFFCPSCWKMAVPPDPIEKCPHCFEDSEGLCRICRRNPDLPFSRAFVFEDTEVAMSLAKLESEDLVAFAMVQWVNLEWPLPDIVIPMPGAEGIARQFSAMIGRPMVCCLTYRETWECDAESLDTDLVLLVIDKSCSKEECHGAIQALSSTFPKRGYLLSLFSKEAS